MLPGQKEDNIHWAIELFQGMCRQTSQEVFFQESAPLTLTKTGEQIEYFESFKWHIATVTEILRHVPPKYKLAYASKTVWVDLENPKLAPLGTYTNKVGTYEILKQRATYQQKKKLEQATRGIKM